MNVVLPQKDRARDAEHTDPRNSGSIGNGTIPTVLPAPDRQRRQGRTEARNSADLQEATRRVPRDRLPEFQTKTSGHTQYRYARTPGKGSSSPDRSTWYTEIRGS